MEKAISDYRDRLSFFLRCQNREP